MCQQVVFGRLRRGWLLGCVASLAALPVVGAESLPASVRACSAITDSLQRLVCYDREVAKFPAPAAKAAEKSAPGGQQAAGSQSAVGGAAAVATNGGAQAAGAAADRGTVSASSAPGATSAPATTSSGSGHSAAATTGAQAAPTSAASTAKSNSTSVAMASGDDHVTAHIVSIDHHPNEMILHLDNGQVWQEVQSVSGDLSLREGDAIKIDRHFGSFWLSGPHVSSMKVQRKT